MPLDFPGSPNQGDTYTFGDITFEFDGTKWFQVPAASAVNLDDVTTNGNTTTNSITTGGLHVNSTGAVEMPTGTTAERPSGTPGMIRFNTENNSFEGYDSDSWGTFDETKYYYNLTSSTISRQSNFTIVQNWDQSDVTYTLDSDGWLVGDIVRVSTVQGLKTTVAASKIYLPDGSSDSAVFLEQAGSITVAKHTLDSDDVWMILT